MMKQEIKHISVFIILLISSFYVNAIPPINILRPSDRPLMAEPYAGTCNQYVFGNESSVGKSYGYQEDIDDLIPGANHGSSNSTKVNIMQLYQCKQNVRAAFNGFDSRVDEGQISQRFNISGDSIGCFTPTGKFSVPFNILLSSYYYFHSSFAVSLYLPVLSMELSDVNWCEERAECSDVPLQNDLAPLLKRVADLDIMGWKRTGVGDLVAQIRWMDEYPQFRPILKSVRPQVRFGLNIPTGKVADEDKILALPFGNDGSWGIQLAGGLDLMFASCLRGGIDVEFLYLFGNTRCRRVKTDCDQTDLLFLAKVPAFKEYGLGQQYNLYVESFWRSLAFKLNYQYLRRNEDKLYVIGDRIDNSLVNSAESLYDWTAHSFLFNFRSNFGEYFPEWGCKPSVLAWFKLGFNGKRAILLNTVGAQLELNF